MEAWHNILHIIKLNFENLWRFLPFKYLPWYDDLAILGMIITPFAFYLWYYYYLL